MQTFLQYVAKDIIAKHGGENLADIAVVFPNKRASIFLNQALFEEAGHAVWSPSYITISDLFRHHSDLKVPDQIELIFRLYREYVKLTGSTEPLDHFFSWGQLMLADFDDLDKNLVEADKLFINLEAWQEMRDFSFLSEQQRKSLREFFGKVETDTVLQEKFNDIWKNLGPLYHTFRDSLRKDGLAYEGMLYRDVVERDIFKDNAADFHFKHYIFVGFNLLQKVEQRFFRKMRDTGVAEFYWDYDTYFMTSQHEAGRYIRRYLDHLPNELGPGRASNGIDTDAVYDNLRKPKNITYISAPTEDVQARYVATWLRGLGNVVEKDPCSVAIVLCDESLLQNVIHCLPGTVKNVNITTGFPLSATPAATLVGVLLALRLQGLNKDGKTYRLSYVNQVLRHPYAKFISDDAPVLYEKLNAHKTYFPAVRQLTEEQGPELVRLFDTKDIKEVTGRELNVALLQWVADILKFVGIGSREEKDPLMHESVFRMYTVINRLKDLFAQLDAETTPVLLQRLLSQLINATSIPFHGEPAIGIQIMGVLETRNLDFEHVLLLSCNEGNIPKGINDTSFIPHSLRKGYEMTTVENKVAIYSYYFHSLLQRAADVTITFNNATDDGRQGEMSRFMLQFMVESGQTIKRLTMQSGQSVSTVNRVPVEKDETVQKKLAGITSLSPTAISRYLRCQLMFYYNTICGLREDDDDDQEIDNKIFGDIFHRTAELIYEDLSGKDHRNTITAEILDRLVTKERYKIDAYLDQAFREKLFKVDQPDFHPRYNGLQLLNRNVLQLYIQRLLRLDKANTPFDILALESSFYDNLSFGVNGTERTISLGGQIDRIDRIGEQLRVIDYKTGKPLTSSAPTVNEIFNTEYVDSKHTGYYLQAFLYSAIIRKSKEAIAAVNPGNKPVAPALLFIREAGKEDYNPILKVKGEGQEDKCRASYFPVDDIDNVYSSFIGHLRSLLSEIFDFSRPFKPTEEKDRCTNCIYKDICG